MLLKRRRWLVLLAGAAGLAALAAGCAWMFVGSQALSGLAAKSTCTCLFVSERPEEICTGDELKAQGIGFVPVTVDRSARAVQARAFGLQGARAVFHEATGCTVE